MGIVWLESREIIHIQNELMSEHGGLPGPPDEGALQSTLARPLHLLAVKQSSTLFDLAASYGHGFARNHCFPDGNKRMALESIDVFLIVNGHELMALESSNDLYAPSERARVAGSPSAIRPTATR